MVKSLVMTQQNKNKKQEFLFSDKLVPLTLFILVLFIVTAWINYHLGVSQWFVVVMGLFSVLYTVIGQIIGLATEEEESALKKFMRSSLLFFLKTPVLIILYTIVLCVGNIVSTVRVYADGVNHALEFQLAPEGEVPEDKFKELTDPNDVVSTWVLTNPFGRSYYLEAKGYLRYSFEVYPWVGSRVKINHDLEVQPSLLIRVKIKSRLLGGGKFVITSQEDSIEVVIPEDGGIGSVLIGSAKSIPEQWVTGWERSLIAEIPADVTHSDSQPAIMEYIQGWLSYEQVDAKLSMAPGTRIQVKFYNRVGKKMAASELVVTNQEFQDFLIRTL